MPDQDSEFRPIYVIAGDESYLRRKTFQTIKNRIIGPDPDPLYYSEFAGDSALAMVLDELRTMPLLPGHRLVVVQDADAFLRSNRDQLAAYFQHPTSTASLLLMCNTLDTRLKISKLIQQVGKVFSCTTPKGSGIIGWIQKQAREAYEKELDRGAADTLRRLIGDDLGMLDSEIAKLSVFVGDRTRISAADVDVLVGLHREEKVFGIAEAMLRGDARSGLELWEQVWATDPAVVGRGVGGLAWAVRRHIQCKLELDQGQSHARVARQLWKDPAVVKAMFEHTDIGQLTDQVAGLLEVDVAVKSGQASLRTAMERLIVTRSVRRRDG